MLKLAHRHKDKAVETDLLQIIAVFNRLPIKRLVDPPTSPTSAGLPGQIARDTTYIYFCFEKDTWVRIAKDAW
jgi:hypothetical protein